MDPVLENCTLAMDRQEVGLAASPQSRVTDDPWASAHFRCTLTGADGRSVTVTVGCDDGQPTIDDVIAVLGIEAATVEAAASFEDWAVALGYDPDSRYAERVYRAARRRARRLRDLLGAGDYGRLVGKSQRSVAGMQGLTAVGADRDGDPGRVRAAAGARSRRAARGR